MPRVDLSPGKQLNRIYHVKALTNIVADQASCDAAYSGTSLDGLVTVSGGKQSFTAPFTGAYAFEVIGAAGRSAESGFDGGVGAVVTGKTSVQHTELCEVVFNRNAVTHCWSDSGTHRGAARLRKWIQWRWRRRQFRG